MHPLIEQKIKKLYGSKASFYRKLGKRPTDQTQNEKYFKNKVKWLNDFLEPLGLEIKIVEK